MEEQDTALQMETDQPPRCPRCPMTFESTLQVFFSDIFIEDLLQQGNNNDVQRNKDYFKKLFCALLNCENGNVVVFHVEDVRILNRFDEVGNDLLMKLVPDNACYHDVFERVIIDENHFRVRVKPRRDSECMMSTFRFHSSLSRDTGLDKQPSYHNMQRVFENARDGQGFCIGTPYNIPDNAAFQRQQEVRVCGDPQETVPFQESMWLQAKRIWDGLSPEEMVELMWGEKTKGVIKHELGKYISAFSKVPHGGIIYFGIRQETGRTNGNVKSFVSEGVYLEERDIPILKRQFKKRLENLFWVRVAPENSGDDSGNSPITAGKFEVIPLNGGSQSCCIIKITVYQFQGVCFFRKEGPESYVLNERDEPVPVGSWSDWAEGSHCEDFQPVTVQFDGLDL